MIKKTFFSALLTIAVVTLCMAADFTGHWTGRIMDQFDIAYDFKADGDKLTGNSTGPDGNKTDILNGKIAGNEISFDMPVMGETIPFKGKIEGEILKLSFSVQGNELSVDLKKGELK